MRHVLYFACLAGAKLFWISKTNTVTSPQSALNAFRLFMVGRALFPCFLQGNVLMLHTIKQLMQTA